MADFPGYGLKPPPARRRKKPVQQSIAFESETKRLIEQLVRYDVGGWKEYSKWIDPRTVPLCDHDHGLVDPEIGKRLMKHFLMPSLLRWRCLSAPWREYATGTRCITYGTVGEDRQFDLWIGTDAQAPSGP